ncbi:MAG: GIY-YIG nuclease family protein [Candidatus Colwellbacteria bacterium]|nr:GIY-YIG nuclease family protein [Candidatus Colwellbacteria bacterium]
MYYIYIIQHTTTKQIYIGKTNNIKRRIAEHNNGQQKATYRVHGEWTDIYGNISKQT